MPTQQSGAVLHYAFPVQKAAETETRCYSSLRMSVRPYFFVFRFDFFEPDLCFLFSYSFCRVVIFFQLRRKRILLERGSAQWLGFVFVFVARVDKPQELGENVEKRTISAKMSKSVLLNAMQWSIPKTLIHKN